MLNFHKSIHPYLLNHFLDIFLFKLFKPNSVSLRILLWKSYNNKFLKLSPKKFEVISLRPRIMARQVREAERQIYNLCVQKSKMPRKEFLDLFKDNSTNLKFLDPILKKVELYFTAFK